MSATTKSLKDAEDFCIAMNRPDLIPYRQAWCEAEAVCTAAKCTSDTNLEANIAIRRYFHAKHKLNTLHS